MLRRILRYVTAELADQFDKRYVEFKPTGIESYNIVTDTITEWHIVQADDPRVNTIVDIDEKEGEQCPQ